MRTKTMILSALLGALGSVSVHAQNVYSLNAVGYINVTLSPGFNIVACPLIATDPSGLNDNTISNLLGPNTNGQYKKWQIYNWNPTATPPTFVQESGTPSGWLNGGTNTIAPGQAVWIQNPSNGVSPTVTFVGTVPTGTLTNPIYPGYNLVGSIVPASGDMLTNSIMLLTNSVTPTKKDQIYTWNPLSSNFTQYGAAGSPATWVVGGDPVLPNVGTGFWYESQSTATNYWVENYTVNP
jgi:hypothetical protein